MVVCYIAILSVNFISRTCTLQPDIVYSS